MSNDRLKKYRKKRDFSLTSEPGGDTKKFPCLVSTFVIQEHHASHLHFDFRLEIEGVFVSWAVPKGVPKRTGIKRLAVQTEDHPLSYGTFTGTIPQGQYGGGEVSIHDKGTYYSVKIDKEGSSIGMPESLKKGSIEICLEGSIYKGWYALVRTTMGAKKNNWLLMKIKKKW